ncbi:MAG TPA: hypothetical protein VFQ68_40670 [Streptosporangiaceae bacterium]|nr:hypothetical protein [Streptosporangiaceae bacterium]
MPDKAGSGPSPLERLVEAQRAEKKVQRKKDSRALAAIALAAVVLTGGGVFAFVHYAPESWRHRVTALVKSSASARASQTAAPVLKLTAQPLSPVDTDGPPADPFADTAAASWGSGAAAITIPPVRAHGPYTAAQVRSAYETTRKLLVAANLDWPTLRGGTPAAFEHLLIKSERTQFVAGLHDTKLDKQGRVENTRTWVTSFAPGSTTFVTTDVRVSGTMSAGTATESGTEVLRIKVDYIFAFAVEPPGDPADWMRIVVQRYGSVDFAQWDDPSGPLEPWFNITTFPAGGQCGERDGYIHPDYPSGPPSSIKPSGKPVNPYSFADPSGLKGCTSTTGT